MAKSLKNCKNCGHNCHCGGKCKQNYTGGDSKKIKIVCCHNCQCKTEKKVKK
jgi:hypothetical protein